jgi:hypothetical protein
MQLFFKVLENSYMLKLIIFQPVKIHCFLLK